MLLELVKRSYARDGDLQVKEKEEWDICLLRLKLF